MKPRLTLFAALCALNPALRADDQLLGDELRIVPGSFALSDPATQPIALWLERGHAAITVPPAEVDAAALSLPAQSPSASVCLLPSAPRIEVTAINLRLKFLRDGEVSTPDIINWELAGVPIRFNSDGAGRWRVEFHTTQDGWHPLLAPEGEDLGADWHVLHLEFSASPRSWRLRWDSREAGPWIPQAHPEAPLLVVAGGAHTAVWLDDIATAEAPSAPSASDNLAVASAARIAALRLEIEAAVRDLARETGVRRQRILRRHHVVVAPRPSGSVQASGLTVLTNLEERQTDSPSE